MKNNKQKFNEQANLFYKNKSQIITNKGLKILGFPFKTGINEDSISQIEFGLKALKKNKKIKDYKLINEFEENCYEFTKFEKNIASKIEDFDADIIFLENLQKNNFPADKKILNYFKNLNVPISYFEWNPWSYIRKRPTAFLNSFFSIIDINFIKGGGTLYNVFNSMGAKNISFTVHPFNENLINFNTSKRSPSYEISMFCNYWPSKYTFLNMDGVTNRKEIVTELKIIYGDRFQLFGKNWNKDFNATELMYKDVPKFQFDSKVNLGWEHYSKIPFYFSNRLPNSFFLGVPYFSNKIIGLENILPYSNFLSFKNTNDLHHKINHLISDEDLYNEISLALQNFSNKNFSILNIFQHNLKTIENLYH